MLERFPGTLEKETMLWIGDLGFARRETEETDSTPSLRLVQNFSRVGAPGKRPAMPTTAIPSRCSISGLSVMSSFWQLPIAFVCGEALPQSQKSMVGTVSTGSDSDLVNDGSHESSGNIAC